MKKQSLISYIFDILSKNMYICLLIVSINRTFDMRRGKKKTYYVCFEEEKGAFIATSMQAIADFLSINQKTVARHMLQSNTYKGKTFIIYKGITIHTIKRGFAK